MEDFREKILDWHEDEPSKHWFNHWSVAFIPVFIFALGTLFKFLHWPFATLLMAGGLFLILIRSILLFFSKKRDKFDWIYFIGRISLILALAVNFALFPVGRKILLVALSLFGISVLTFLLKKKTPSDESPENSEDDY